METMEDFQQWFFRTLFELDRKVSPDFTEVSNEGLLLVYGLMWFFPLHLLIQANRSFRQCNNPTEFISNVNTLVAFLVEIPFIKRIPALYEITRSKGLCLAFIRIGLFKDRVRKEILKRMSEHGMSKATVKYLLYQDAKAIQFLFYAMANTLVAWKKGKPSKLLLKAFRTPYAANMELRAWVSNQRFTELNKIWEKQHDVLALVSAKAQVDPFPQDWEHIELPMRKDTSPIWKKMQPILLRIFLGIAWNWYPALEGKFDNIQFKLFNQEKDKYEQAIPETETKFESLDLEEKELVTKLEMQALTYKEFNKTYPMPTPDEILYWLQNPDGGGYRGPLLGQLTEAIANWTIWGDTQEEACRKANISIKTFKNVLSKLRVRDKNKKNKKYF